MRGHELEKYFDNELYLVRFNNIQDLEKRLKDDKDLKVIGYDFKSYYDNLDEDYNLILSIEDTDGTKYDLDIWYAITRNGARIIVETNYEEWKY